MAEMLTKDGVDPRISQAVVGLCDAITTMVLPHRPDRFEEARAKLSYAAHEVDRRMSRHLTHGQLREARGVRPACIAELKLGHADLQVHICNAFRETAIGIRDKHRRVFAKA